MLNTPTGYQFAYLGTLINEDRNHSQKLRLRPEKARTACNLIPKPFKSNSLNIDIKY